MAGSLLGEISFTKLITAWLILFIVPAVIVGLAPLIASAWVAKFAGKITSPLFGIVPIAILLAVATLGWLFGRRLFRLAESNFWSLNAVAIEPAYTFCREALRHLAERILPEDAVPRRRERLRSWAAAVAGLLISALALLVAILTWPSTRWIGGVGDLLSPWELAWVALANTVVVVSAYLAVAGARMGARRCDDGSAEGSQAAFPSRRPAPALGALPTCPMSMSSASVMDSGSRVAGRARRATRGFAGCWPCSKVSTPRRRSMRCSFPATRRTPAAPASGPSSSMRWPTTRAIAERVLLLPGNHDVNIVDRANPARLDLSIGPNSRLRKIRTLSAINTIQGSRVRVVDPSAQKIGATLAEALQPHAADLTKFAATGRPYFSTSASDRWDEVFPMVLPPDGEDGLGIILSQLQLGLPLLLHQCAGDGFGAQAKAIDIAFAQHPRACWLIGTHHHPVEYPRAAKVLSERVGTTLVNGNWFLRGLQPMANRCVLMHGHRHIDWIGECGGLVIVSAPSPIMEAKNDADTYFYIHTLEIGADNCLRLLAPATHRRARRSPESREHQPK